MSIKDWIKFVLLGLIWGTNYLWIKIALNGVGPFSMVAIRCLFATMALFCYNVKIRSKFPPSKHWGFLAIMGIFNLAVPFILITWSEQFISSGLASILHSTSPLITILIAHFALENDRINTQKIIGLLLGFFGVILLVSEELGSGDKNSLLGEIAMLLAATSLATSLILAQKKSMLISPEILSAGQVIIGFIFASSFIPIFESNHKLPTQPLVWISLMWLGFINSSIGPLLHFSLIRDIGATRTSLLTFIFPLVGVVSGVIFLGENLSWHILAGGILIILGIAVVNSQTAILTRWLQNMINTEKGSIS